MVKHIHFNTRRQYTANGQRISATLREDTGTVTFWDHDRMVDGEFVWSNEWDFTSKEVMAEYDGGRYVKTTQSWADGMMRGGVNSEYKGH